MCTNNKRAKLYVYISGHKYDLTNFHHPVPINLYQYNGLDATEVFMLLHGEKQFKILAKYRCE